jgi:hypothetical protein
MCAALLPSPATERLVRIAGMLGSDFEGERANAAAAATRLLQQHGMTWRDLIECGCPASPRPASPQWGRGDHRERAARLLARARTLDRWEREFLQSIAKWTAPLSPKQAAVLERIERERSE